MGAGRMPALPVEVFGVWWMDALMVGLMERIGLGARSLICISG
jgi:hypothetical protein